MNGGRLCLSPVDLLNSTRFGLRLHIDSGSMLSARVRGDNKSINEQDGCRRKSEARQSGQRLNDTGRKLTTV